MINEHDLRDYKEAFEFTYMNTNGSRVTKQFQTHSLDKIIEEFEMFLKGAGFHFDGHISVEEYYE